MHSDMRLKTVNGPAGQLSVALCLLDTAWHAPDVQRCGDIVFSVAVPENSMDLATNFPDARLVHHNAAKQKLHQLCVFLRMVVCKHETLR